LSRKGTSGFARGMTRCLLRTLCVMLLSLLIAGPCLAVDPSEMLPDPALEARARAISRELRCVVCQNQSIDDSAAEVAHDMRRAVRERLAAGASDRAVTQFMVARYGDFVLLDPPFKARTLVLWLGAPALLLLAAAALWRAARRRPAMVAPAPLSEEERQRLAVILSEAKGSATESLVIPRGPLPAAQDDGRGR